MSQRHERSALADSILQYLARHGQAADTAFGIARCWIGQDDVAPSPEDVEAVLADLVRAGVLEQRQLPDGTTIYRRAGREN
jgi:hypothetical protein